MNDYAISSMFLSTGILAAHTSYRKGLLRWLQQDAAKSPPTGGIPLMPSTTSKVHIATKEWKQRQVWSFSALKVWNTLSMYSLPRWSPTHTFSTHTGKIIFTRLGILFFCHFQGICQLIFKYFEIKLEVLTTFSFTSTTPESGGCKGEKCFHQKQEEILFFLNKVLNHNRMWNVWDVWRKEKAKKVCPG